MRDERILWEAKFNEKVTTYWLLNGMIILAVTVIGICLLPIWYFVGKELTNRYLRTYSCTLTNRSLKFSRGWLVRVEKTVPLDRITDLGLMQGPIMRWLDIEALSVETAGQSAMGALLTVSGIEDGRAFRDAVLEQRDRVVGSQEDAAEKAGEGVASSDDSTLRAIHETLLRIESQLSDRE